MFVNDYIPDKYLNLSSFQLETYRKKYKNKFKFKHYVQTAFVLIAMLCVPVMLFTKPMILLKRHKDKKNVTEKKTYF
jgi:hypothetical protein